MDTSETSPGRHNRAAAGDADTSDDLPVIQKKRRQVRYLHFAFVVDKELEQGYALR